MPNFYVAGIEITHVTQDYYDIESLSRHVIRLIPQIHEEGTNTLGKDAIIIIVLYEYALTPAAVHADKVELCVKNFLNCLKNYPNVILIPGSFAFYKSLREFPNSEMMIKKISEHYSGLNQYDSIKNDDDFIEEIENFYKNTIIPTQEVVCLQNTTYIISDSVKKHKKSFTAGEREILKSGMPSLFHIGRGESLKHIQHQGYKFDLSVVICKEAYAEETINKQLKATQPLIEVVVSNTIHVDKNHLFGALNIHMDYSEKLTVTVQEDHPKANELKEIKGMLYSYHESSGVLFKMPEKINYLSKANVGFCP